MDSMIPWLKISLASTRFGLSVRDTMGNLKYFSKVAGEALPTLRLDVPRSCSDSL